MPAIKSAKKATPARSPSALLSRRIGALERRVALLANEIGLLDSNRLHLSQKFAEQIHGEDAVTAAIAKIPTLDSETLLRVRASWHPYAALLQLVQTRPQQLN